MIRAKKNLGQNFLTDGVILNRIIEVVSPRKGDHFFEIGAGKGALTELLSQHINSLDSIEIDRYLIEKLKKLESSSANLKIHEGSILETELKTLIQDKSKFRVIGNLPYNISTKILFWTFNNSEHVLDVHYMLQREFGERLISPPGNKAYGRISVLTQYMFECEGLFKISPSSFTPKPSVESILIKLKPRPGIYINSPEAIKLQELTRIMFTKRRKKISTSCKSILNLKEFNYLNVNPDFRPESLDLKDFLKITKFLIKRDHG